MRLLITADLHYDNLRSRESAREAAREICARGGDALALVGDTAGPAVETLGEALDLFAGFSGRKLFVPGNHSLWCRTGEDSLDRYRRVLPQVAGEHGFTMLDHEPCVMGATGLVGSVGWYDYSFADPGLAVPEAFYRVKISPGAARYLGRHHDLMEQYRQEITERHLALGARWMDGEHVRLPMTDEQFTQELARTLGRQLEQVAARVERIIACIHHLPFADLVPQGRPDRFAFAAAYMGAGVFGEALLACPKVTHVYCGHSHWPARRQIGHIAVINVGSTYVAKRIEQLDLSD